MTTFAVPPAGAPAWRELYPVLPDVTTGRWCPLDDTTLQNHRDGWVCPTCAAWWDFRGLHGRWLADIAAIAVPQPVVRFQPSPLLVVAGAAGAAVVLMAVLVELDTVLVWWLAAAVAAAAVLYGAAAVVSRVVADRPYRHNQVIEQTRQVPGGC